MGGTFSPFRHLLDKTGDRFRPYAPFRLEHRLAALCFFAELGKLAPELAAVRKTLSVYSG